MADHRHGGDAARGRTDALEEHADRVASVEGRLAAAPRAHRRARTTPRARRSGRSRRSARTTRPFRGSPHAPRAPRRSTAPDATADSGSGVSATAARSRRGARRRSCAWAGTGTASRTRLPAGARRAVPGRRRQAAGRMSTCCSVSNASTTSSNATRSPPRSGCVTSACVRKARRISSGPASASTPRSARARRPSMATSSLKYPPVRPGPSTNDRGSFRSPAFDRRAQAGLKVTSAIVSDAGSSSTTTGRSRRSSAVLDAGEVAHEARAFLELHDHDRVGRLERGIDGAVRDRPREHLAPAARELPRDVGRAARRAPVARRVAPGLALRAPLQPQLALRPERVELGARTDRRRKQAIRVHGHWARRSLIGRLPARRCCRRRSRPNR